MPLTWKPRLRVALGSSSPQPLILRNISSYRPRTGHTRRNPLPSNLDWVNAMCFDYHGSWDTSATGAHAALYDPSSNISTSFGIGSWLNSGVPSHKVVMGMSLYGRSWILKSLNQTGIGAPAVAAGPKQNLSAEIGIMFFSEIRDFIKEKNATEVFDKKTVSAYSYSSNLIWVGYDNKESVAAKILFAKRRHLLGYFFWAISQDSNWMLSTQGTKSIASWFQMASEINLAFLVFFFNKFAIVLND